MKTFQMANFWESCRKPHLCVRQEQGAQRASVKDNDAYEGARILAGGGLSAHNFVP
ncbi:MAG TPA: hypothetical protein VMR33_10170 [Candidatus Baltobacteraceae bacterium]|nr:hypothetical protein [Candidatus Baltobacteraceae bacterium]